MIRGIIIFALGAISGALVVLTLVDREQSLRSQPADGTLVDSLQSSELSDAPHADEPSISIAHLVPESPEFEAAVAIPDQSTPVTDELSTVPLASGKSRKRAAQNRTEREVSAVEEVAPLLDEEPASRLHESFESEAREDSWAPYMEQQISLYLGSRTELANFTFPLIQCRESICEIHAVGYGPDAYVIWAAAIGDIPDQPWSTFTGMSSSARNAESGDILGMLVILHSEGG